MSRINHAHPLRRAQRGERARVKTDSVMLWNDRLLFLHVPKAAGTSVTSFLIRNLPGKIFLTEPLERLDSTPSIPVSAKIRLKVRRLRRTLSLLRRPSLEVVEGTRHENLREARDILERRGQKLEGFEAILTIIRNPYDLEVSRFHFFRRGHMGVKGLANEYAEELALGGDFAAFARLAPYHGQLPGRIEDWFELEGHIPGNMRIIRFESLAQELEQAVSPFCCLRARLPKLNASDHACYATYLTPEIEEAIYQKYRWPFDRGYYKRVVF